jgi:hypothetical protein
MISRKWAAPTLLAASVALPYGASNAGWLERFRGGPSTAPAASNQAAGSPSTPPFPPTPHANPALSTSPPGPNATLYPAKTPLEGEPSYSLADVLRLDVSKEWVYQRWPRKSTALSDLDRYGVRVPLVSGTKLFDLAGSLTYFFGADGRVQRISFRGHTGDTTQVVAIVTQRFGLQRQPSMAVGEQLFQIKRGDDVFSELRTRPAPVLWASSPHDSFSVELELQDPATARPLNPPAPPLPGAASPQPSAVAAATSATTGPAASAGSAQAASADESASSRWEALFPRSRVPKTQLENLERYSVSQ